MYVINRSNTLLDVALALGVPAARQPRAPRFVAAVPESEAGVQAFPIWLATSPQPGPGRSGLQRGVADCTRHLTLRRKDLGRIRARLTADSYERKPNEINPPGDTGGRCRTSLSLSHG